MQNHRIFVISRRLFSLLLPASTTLLADSAYTILRGRFSRGGKLTRPGGGIVILTGDEETKLVLDDPRLEGSDFEALGHPAPSPDRFTIGPIHERNMWVHKDGKRLMVTYWCPICYIRTYSPGLCMCCREDTKLDLRDPSLKEREGQVN